MSVPVIGAGPVTVEEFYAFAERRPDGEKWELIDGEPILNAAPSSRHQWIVRNVVLALGTRGRELNATWAVLPGFGVRVSDIDRPEPDVLVIPAHHYSPGPWERDTGNVIIAFEVLSPSTRVRDLGWKRAAYTRLAFLTHYIVIAQDAAEVVVFARDDDFAGRRLCAIDDVIELRPLGVEWPVGEIYRGTGLGPVI